MDGKLYLLQFVVASICPVFYSLFNLFDSIDYRLLVEKRIWWLEDAKNYGNRSEKKGKGFFDGLIVIYYMRFTPNPFGQFG